MPTRGSSRHNWPWLAAGEMGDWLLTPAQAAKLRDYLLRGGFLYLDDFWGPQEWDAFEVSMKAVFPDRQIIEIDSADKPWSVAKLQHAAAAGMEAIWVRWGDDDWSGVYADIDVIQLRIRRSADRRSSAGQLAFWPAARR